MRLFSIFLIFFLAGCQTTPQKSSDAVKIKDVRETQEVVGSLSGAMTPGKATVHYCPVCGRRFSPSVKVCPFDKTKLEEVK